MNEAATGLKKPGDKIESRRVVTAIGSPAIREPARSSETASYSSPAPAIRRTLGASAPMQSIFRMIDKVAPSRASVLITGETGTGKELVAHAIHDQSPRARGPFVKLHCGALAETILESELFGHEKGAFTGSLARREGRFRQADGGTLFLDEIGDVPLSTQVKLLRFLQERTFERVGGNETLTVDVRIVAATNRDLPTAIAKGHFREDLFYRLNVVALHMPPLRERPGDLLLLATHFLSVLARGNGKQIEGFDAGALARLREYRWPGNVRELENAVERCVVLCDDRWITSEHLPGEPGDGFGGLIRVPGSTLADVERRTILATLSACGGHTGRAAEMLGVSIRKVQYKLHEYGLSAEGAGVVKAAPTAVIGRERPALLAG